MHTFILRLTRDAAGRVRGVLERVRTGEKVPVQGLGTLGLLVGQMLGAGEDAAGRVRGVLERVRTGEKAVGPP